MKIKPSYEEFAKLAVGGSAMLGGNTVPLYSEMLADTETPVSAYLKLRAESSHSFLLESVEGGEGQARYSFLGARPIAVFRSTGDRIMVEDCASGKVQQWNGDAIAALRKFMAPYKSVQLPGLPRFTGGAVGYLGYDGIRLVEDLPDSCENDLGLEDMTFALYDAIVAFDNYRHTVLLIANVHIDGDLVAAYEKACARIGDLADVLARPLPLSSTALAGGRPRSGAMPTVRSNMSRSSYEESVRRCLEYIRAGDIFQVVFSQRFEVQIGADPLDIYRVLRTVNPSPYMFHIALDGLQILGASPEILVRVEDGVIDVRPIAGTRPRGMTEAEDEALADELLADDKDRAEHVMLIDLGRNDVGRVSKFDTVRVTEMMAVERYSHVMHIVSNVRGELESGMDSIDALFACYPAGTLSGAPKIRAMEIIDEIEPQRRGIYGGAVGYLDFSGNLDTCIAIRTMVIKGSTAYIQAGGGIVADSQPDLEYQETVNKAMALLRALEMAERGSIAPSGESIDGLHEGTEPTFLDSTVAQQEDG